MEYDEEADEFYFFGIIHCRHAAIAIGLLGISIVVLLSLAGVTCVEWRRHEPLVSSLALAAVAIFACLGVTAHVGLLRAVCTARTSYLISFFVFHSFVIAVSSITSLIAVGEVVSEQDSRLGGVGGGTERGPDQLARSLLIILPITCCFQVLLMVAVVKVKWYLRLRYRYIRAGRPPRINQISTTGEDIGRLASIYASSNGSRGSVEPAPRPLGFPDPPAADLAGAASTKRPPPVQASVAADPG